MARHADPDEDHFVPTLLGAAGKALAVVLGVAAVTAVVVVLGDGPRGGSPAMVEPDEASATTTQGSPPTEEATASPAADIAAADAEADLEPTTEPDAPSAPEPAATTVQVLDGGAGPALTQEVADLLAGAGYDVVAVNKARCCYEVTTALWSEGQEAAAVGLADGEPRIGEVRENPNLSQDVDVHVVVGTDWTS